MPERWFSLNENAWNIGQSGHDLLVGHPDMNARAQDGKSLEIHGL